jgi:hypothetical protein
MTALGVLDEAQQALVDGVDPDGAEARGALLLATDTALAAAAAGPPDIDRWTFAAVALGEARDRLEEDLTEHFVLTVEPIQLNAATARQAQAPMRTLVESLAETYASAATHDAQPPWRRLVWADVAQHLDRAVAELR